MSTYRVAVQDRPVVAQLAVVAGFAVAMALSAQVAIPLPGTPVPLTLQPMIVVLAGLWLSPRAAAASMIAYLTAGALGLPVFAPVGAPGLLRLMGPTGGYLLAYPLAAAVTSIVARMSASYSRRALACIAGMAVIYAGGLLQLTVITGSVGSAALLGAAPFLALDLIKAHLAALAAPRRPVSREG